MSIENTPRGSIGSSSIDLESGAKLEIDLGGGVVETGGRVIKDSTALDTMLEEMEMIRFFIGLNKENRLIWDFRKCSLILKQVLIFIH